MSQALYRRYRPERFADIIGQEHVTGPLMQALQHDRVNHAYLFSGPRGCGKTTSARILARCLNCDQGPTPEPCGECQSCRDLARGGPGSIDVIEIDAASHGGVDDARELRERANYAPAMSRYKVYIIDEAHMVSPQGFNALLKVVEEPPSFLKFIFATTEPEKVIGTIRSRTHHYPFRLVPSRTLETYLGEVCVQEDVVTEPGVLPLVVRSGAGSVRDSLSVLDQLIGGATGNTVSYDGAVQLLGFTPAALLDEILEALGGADGGGVFSVVDNVIESGIDPRRFLEDLMQRLRDLVIVAAVPEAFATGLVVVPDDQRDRLVAQAARLGLAALTRATDLVATGLTELRGATAPRLQLEIVCAKLLLPSAHHDEASLAVRLDRLERRLSIGGVTGGATTPAPPAPPAARTAEPAAEPAVGRTGDRAAPGPTSSPTSPADEPRATGTATAPPAQPPSDAPSGAAPAAGPPAAGTGMDLHEVRRLWPNVLDAVKGYRRAVWMMLFEKSQVVGVDGGRLTLALTDVGSVKAFGSGGKDEIVRQAVLDVLGLDVRVEVVHDPTTSGSLETAAPEAAGPAAAKAPAEPSAAAKQARQAAASVPGPVVGPRTVDVTRSAADDAVTADDADADSDGLTQHDLVIQQLGGTVIGEIDHT